MSDAGAVERDREAAGQSADPAEASVLVVADHTNPEKISRHWGPLAEVAGATTMVCLAPDESVEGIDYRVAPTFGSRYVGLVLLGLLAFVEAGRGDYDMVASISLLPYGIVALVVGALFGLPTHLGIIGMDADRHATAWYGALPRAAFRRFDVVSVPGSAHADALVEMGVERDRIAVLSNAIDTDVYRPAARHAHPEYDFVWVGRFNAEKNPLAFVRALRELHDDGVEFRAVMLGAGPREDRVRDRLARWDIDGRVDLPGWVDDPVEYYRRSAVFVLTSNREGLPLTLLEAMATGVAPVVCPVGSVTDAARHGETAYVVPDPTPAALADAMRTLLEDEQRRSRIAENAPVVRGEYGFENAREDWRRILRTGLGG